jgi:hypothetical protein
MERPCELDRLPPVAGGPDDLETVVVSEQRFDRLDEERLVIGYEHANGPPTGVRCGVHLVEGLYPEEAKATLLAVNSSESREQIQKLLVTGDNRLKQGVSPQKVRESYEQALVVAREAGLEESVRPLVEVRLADLERLSPGSTRSSPPDA